MAEKKMNIRFSGGSANSHRVPASVLNQVLSGIQRALHLLAMQYEEMKVRRKERVTEAIEGKYVLLCEPPRIGSFTMEASLGDPSGNLFAQEDIDKVAGTFEDFSRAVREMDECRIRSLMPDSNRRKRLLEAFGKTIPKGNSGLSVHVGWNGDEFLNSQELSQVLREISSSKGIDEVRTITGRLVRIDFDERKITIRYKPTGRELECFYEESAEEMLLTNPRELVQVTGVVSLNDESGLPKKIVRVEKIRELDLSLFRLDSIDIPSGFKLVFSPSLVLEPKLVEEEQLICIVEESLGIDVVVSNSEEIEESLREEIAMLWESYAMADDSELSPKALELKRNLLERISREDADGQEGC
jgi:hypothetical protein